MIDDLLKQFAEWNDFIFEIKDKNWETALGEGKWRIHDVICHIMFWDQYFGEEAIDRIAKDQALTLKHLDYDQFNQRSLEKGRGFSQEELLAMTLKYRNAILDSIRSMSEDKRSGSYIDADGNVFLVESYLRDFIGHDRHHKHQIEAAISSAG